MACKCFWIVFIALAATSAYKHSHSSYHSQNNDHNLEASHYQRDDRSSDWLTSSEQDASFDGDYQEQSRNTQNYGDRADTAWGPKRIAGRPNPFRYYQIRIQEDTRPLLNHQIWNWDFVFKNVYGYSKAQNHGAINKRGADSDDFLSRSERWNMFTPLVTEDCEEKGYCEDSPDYPHEYVEALLAKLPVANSIFNMDAEPEIEERGNLEGEPVPLCKADVKMIKPDKVRTTEGKWVFVINGRYKKVQGFSETECASEGKPCENLVEYKHNAICKQKYIERSMWALGSRGEMVQVATRIGVCCSCELYIEAKKHYIFYN